MNLAASEEEPIGVLSDLGVLLRGEDPIAAAALVKDYPEIAPALSEVKLLGETPEGVGHQRGEAKIARGYVEAAQRGLEAAHSRVDRLTAILPQRLRTAKRLKLYGGVLSALSNASIVPALALSQSAAALGTALLGCSTSILALVGEHMDQPLFGARKSLGELLTELLDIEHQIREQELELLGMTGAVSAAASLSAARKVNGLAGRLRTLEVIEGLKPGRLRSGTDAPTADNGLAKRSAAVTS